MRHIVSIQSDDPFPNRSTLKVTFQADIAPLRHDITALPVPGQSDCPNHYPTGAPPKRHTAFCPTEATYRFDPRPYDFIPPLAHEDPLRWCHSLIEPYVHPVRYHYLVRNRNGSMGSPVKVSGLGSFCVGVALVGLSGWVAFAVTGSVTSELVSIGVAGGVWSVVLAVFGEPDKWPNLSWGWETIRQALFGLAIGLPLLVWLPALGLDEGSGPAGLNAGQALALGMALGAGFFSSHVKISRRRPAVESEE